MPDAPAGGTPAAAAGTNTDASQRGAGPTDEGMVVAARLLKRHRGDSRRAIAELADENRTHRDEKRELKAKLATFEGADVVVLKGDDLKAYTAYKALGTPDDLKKAVDELAPLRTKVVEQERRTAAIDAAPHVGWNAEAFAAMVKDKGLVVTLVDGKDAKGVAIKVPHVKPAGADDKVATVPVSEWVTANASYLMPSLTTKPAAQAGGAPVKPGVQYVEQVAAGGQGGGTAAANGAGSAPAIAGRPKYNTPGQRAAAAQKTA